MKTQRESPGEKNILNLISVNVTHRKGYDILEEYQV